MTEPIPDDGASLRTLSDTAAAVDAIHRFAAGQDGRDGDLFLSAFAPDATLDFTQPASRFGADAPVMSGATRSPGSSTRWNRCRRRTP